MSPLDLDIENIASFVSNADLESLQPEIDRNHKVMEEGSGEGADFLGWLHLPSRFDDELLKSLEEEAVRQREQAEVFVTIGIGGSYLGAKATVEFMGSAFHQEGENPEVLFAGQNISSDYLSDLLDHIGSRPCALNVISKSGTTTEPAVAFRILKEFLENRMGAAEARKRIVVTTDSSRGALKQLADKEGYRSFVIPDDVGGRYSVLTPVGLLPAAVAGVDIRELLAGAEEAERRTSSHSSIADNVAYRYAATRYQLYRLGKTIEIMAGFHPCLNSFLEWWKQLAGESEGKNGQGLFPASVVYTTDLHSLGQWVQQGMRTAFETFLCLRESRRAMQVPAFGDDADGLNYLAGKSLDFVNEKAYKGTAEAHLEGEMPNMTLWLKDRSAHTLGYLFYSMERAIAMTGYLLHVNPFDQPGVEFYKRNMFRLLDKPGFQKD